jgi:hypothetical protein
MLAPLVFLIAAFLLLAPLVGIALLFSRRRGFKVVGVFMIVIGCMAWGLVYLLSGLYY